MHFVLILALKFCLWVSVAYSSRSSSSSPTRQPRSPVPSSPLSITPAVEVAAARQLLKSLLGNASGSAFVLDSLAPNGTDPCGSASSNFEPGTCGMTGYEACNWSWLLCQKYHITFVNLTCAIRTSYSCVPNLQGGFPVEGPQLPGLIGLDVSGNSGLTGQLSLSGWVEMRSLQYLLLGGCAFGGPLPNTWTAVRGLEILDLRNNRFSGTLPPGLDALENLKRLLLGDNEDLSGALPASWEKLVHLEVLDVTNVCRLCGSTSIFPQKPIETHTTGSHVDIACKVDECSDVWRGLHTVLQGVMAAFASVLGLIAIILIIRRMRHCANARAVAHEAARSTNGGGGSNTSAAVGGNSSNGDRGNATRSQRRARRRRLHYTIHAERVPLYTVEFQADGGVKWSVELVGGHTAAARPGGNAANSAAWSPSQRRQSTGHPPDAGEDRERDVELGLDFGRVNERGGDQGGSHQTSEQQGDGSSREQQLDGQTQTAAGGGGRGRRTQVASSSVALVEMAEVPAAQLREGGSGGANGVGAAEQAEAHHGLGAASEALEAAAAAANRSQQQLVDPIRSSVSTTTAITVHATSNPHLTPGCASRKTPACSSKPLPADAVILMPDEMVACLGQRVVLEERLPPEQTRPAAPVAMAEGHDLAIDMVNVAGGGLQPGAAVGTGVAAAAQETGNRTASMLVREATASPCRVL
ncbi:hypothetical protein VaNZ11_006382 [Volvox africanus]|uniref:Leucine-rich repeat-containing N-terminal plant-type domain-containing protein n=1 Tax=Volvox africanus TaxID=51714 RepID=A0ABQ5S1D1_9CHLO|nr:hypothetical protein VaNZ11_006382 [Volvox africanus]